MSTTAAAAGFCHQCYSEQSAIVSPEKSCKLAFCSSYNYSYAMVVKKVEEEMSTVKDKKYTVGA